MNLPYIYELLVAANGRRPGFLKLQGLQADHEVRLMAQAGLVDATFDDGNQGSFTSINSVTAAGQTFLRTFKDQAIPGEAILANSIAVSQGAVLAKWKSIFSWGFPHCQALPQASE
jgi:hypothetical protein